MAEFYGEYRCAMDDKGRLNFPAKLREQMGEKFVVSLWLENCLVAFPMDEWERQAKKLGGKGMIKYRKIKRLIYAGRTDVSPDKQGRISVSAVLRDYAGLEKEVVVAGVGNCVEIWNPTAWKAVNEDLSSEENMGFFESLDF